MNTYISGQGNRIRRAIRSAAVDRTNTRPCSISTIELSASVGN